MQKQEICKNLNLRWNAAGLEHINGPLHPMCFAHGRPNAGTKNIRRGRVRTDRFRKKSTVAAVLFLEVDMQNPCAVPVPFRQLSQSDRVRESIGLRLPHQHTFVAHPADDDFGDRRRQRSRRTLA